MTDGYWVIRTYEAGAVGEKTKFFVPGARPTSKQKRSEKAEIRKQEQNEYSALKSMARLINENFGNGDLLLGLDYSEEAMDRIRSAASCAETEEERIDLQREAAEHELQLCLRRVKRELSAQGIELRYIGVTADMDGDSGELVRLHHHLIVNAGTEQAFVKRWKLGGVSWSVLQAQDDYTPIAEYLLKQVRRKKDHNKYISARCLVRPQPVDRAATDAELRVPQGGELLYRQEYQPGRPQYIRYLLPEGKRKKAEERKKSRAARSAGMSGTPSPTGEEHEKTGGASHSPTNKRDKEVCQ